VLIFVSAGTGAILRRAVARSNDDHSGYELRRRS
jgi:hypothetical protein